MQGPVNAAFALGGHVVIPKIARYVNRTGAATVRSQFYMVDLLGTQAESTSIEQGASGSCQRNLTPCTQAGINAGFPIVIAMDAAADNAEVDCLECGYYDAAILDDEIEAHCASMPPRYFQSHSVDDILEDIQLGEHLSPTRSNGLAAVLDTLRKTAERAAAGARYA